MISLEEYLIGNCSIWLPSPDFWLAQSQPKLGMRIEGRKSKLCTSLFDIVTAAPGPVYPEDTNTCFPQWSGHLPMQMQILVSNPWEKEDKDHIAVAMATANSPPGACSVVDASASLGSTAGMLALCACACILFAARVPRGRVLAVPRGRVLAVTSVVWLDLTGFWWGESAPVSSAGLAFADDDCCATDLPGVLCTENLPRSLPGTTQSDSNFRILSQFQIFGCAKTMATGSSAWFSSIYEGMRSCKTMADNFAVWQLFSLVMLHEHFKQSTKLCMNHIQSAQFKWILPPAVHPTAIWHDGTTKTGFKQPLHAYSLLQVLFWHAIALLPKGKNVLPRSGNIPCRLSMGTSSAASRLSNSLWEVLTKSLICIQASLRAAHHIKVFGVFSSEEIESHQEVASRDFLLRVLRVSHIAFNGNGGRRQFVNTVRWS